MKRKLLIGVFVIAATILASGLFVPRNNPPIENKIAWDSETTHMYFMKSCADCHSNETKWPWYSYIGPSAFLVWDNVTEGREHFNISKMDMGESDEAGEEVLEGEMPPRDYLLLHQDASLSDSQKQEFAQGLVATFGGESVIHHKSRDNSRDDDE